VRASAPAQRGYEPSRLIDSWAVTEVPGWRSADGKTPIDLVFELQQPVRFNTVVLRAQPGEPVETWAQDVELHASNSGEAGFNRVYAGRLAPNTEVKDSFPDVTARFVMLRVLKAQGAGAPYVSLGELEIYWSGTVKS
jgi:hypothetical protein